MRLRIAYWWLVTWLALKWVSEQVKAERGY